MGIPVLVLGESGTGKSASLRNCKPEDVTVINVANKPLPFKNKIESIPTDDYRKVIAALKTNKRKMVVVDDAQYLMANEFMRRATERGFDKFTEIAQNFWQLVNVVKDLPSDVIVYFLAHIERDANGNEKIKTIGKLLDEKITVEGMFTIVLKTNVTDGQYSFLTQNSGHDTVKSPIGMFGSFAIDNDLKYVDDKIRNYYEIGDFLSDEEMAEIDKEAEKVDFTPRQEGEKKSRRARGKADEKEEKPTEAPKEEAKEEAPARRRRTSGENMNNDDESTPAQTATPEDEQPTESKRRRRVSDDMAEERAAVKAENDAAIANTGMDEAGDDEEVEFDKVAEPELKEPPRRKRRGTENEQEQTSGEQKEAAADSEEKEEPAQEDSGESRPRRRRASAEQVNEEPINPPQESTEAPAGRRRRRG